MNAVLLDFIHDTTIDSIPEESIRTARLALLDLLGVAVSGTRTELSHIIREHAVTQFAAHPDNTARLLFDGRTVSPAGAALAGGFTIDSVDAHDGHKLTKGHIGCAVLPALLAFVDAQQSSKRAPVVSENEFLSMLVIGYEIGARAGMALHQTASDYHTSGAWVSLAVAAIGSRCLNLTPTQTREALGIAEYHGPRSQMMRVIDHPTMLKDGSGWGAMAGVSAAYLAKNSFTGAPAITTEAEEVSGLWSDLGSLWRMQEQYVKLYPVCRWSQPGIIAALALKKQAAFTPNDIERIELHTFHEATRLAARTPQTTEQAQYSLPFPLAVALVHGDVTAADVMGSALHDEAVLGLSQCIEMQENDEYNKAFPLHRIANLIIVLKSGQRLESGPTEASGDPENPLSDTQMQSKFLHYSQCLLGESRAQTLLDHVMRFGKEATMDQFFLQVFPSVKLNNNSSDEPVSTTVGSSQQQVTINA